ncbi:MAG: hypothetical protein JOZ80_13230 [Acidobacteriaceae bacterium]|nr:hypothetical protein [Acidobacteriaceae bacterium]
MTLQTLQIWSAHRSGAGYEGVDEYVPARADPYNTKPDAPLLSTDSGAQPTVHMKQWDAETKFFSVDSNHADILVLKLFNYPAWNAEVNGHRVETQTRENTGQVLIPIVTGQSDVQITLLRTWDQTAGALISLLTASGLLLWSFTHRAHAT